LEYYGNKQNGKGNEAERIICTLDGIQNWNCNSTIHSAYNHEHTVNCVCVCVHVRACERYRNVFSLCRDWSVTNLTVLGITYDIFFKSFSMCGETTKMVNNNYTTYWSFTVYNFHLHRFWLHYILPSAILQFCIVVILVIIKIKKFQTEFVGMFMLYLAHDFKYLYPVVRYSNKIKS
jgi:hypothetical protein